MKNLIVVFLLTLSVNCFAKNFGMTDSVEMRKYKQDSGIYNSLREENQGCNDRDCE